MRTGAEKKTNAIPVPGFVKRGWSVVLPLNYLSAFSKFVTLCANLTV